MVSGDLCHMIGWARGVKGDYFWSVVSMVDCDR